MQYRGRPTVDDRLHSFPDSYVVIDIETTGLSPVQNEIIEVAAVRVSDNLVVESFSSLTLPTEAIPLEITRITGISNEMLKDARPLDEVLVEFNEFVGDSILMGYNVKFDIDFLYYRLQDLFPWPNFYNKYVDVLDFAREKLKELSSRSQSKVAEYFGIDTKGAHRALKDCYTCHAIFQRFKEMYEPGYHIPVKAPLWEVTRLGMEQNNFKGQRFACRGRMEQLTTYNLENLILGLGGEISKTIDEELDYLIIGLGKEQYMEQRENGIAIALKNRPDTKLHIIKEELFLNSLKQRGWVK